MSIKARANVTISRIIDVEAEIRYYLSQSSDLPTPEKPTTYPPPSTWASTEPDIQMYLSLARMKESEEQRRG